LKDTEARGLPPPLPPLGKLRELDRGAIVTLPRSRLLFPAACVVPLTGVVARGAAVTTAAGSDGAAVQGANVGKVSVRALAVKDANLDLVVVAVEDAVVVAGSVVDVDVDVILVPVVVGATVAGVADKVEELGFQVTLAAVEGGLEASTLLLSMLGPQSRWMYSPLTTYCDASVPRLKLPFVGGYASFAKLGSLTRHPSNSEYVHISQVSSERHV